MSDKSFDAHEYDNEMEEVASSNTNARYMTDTGNVDVNIKEGWLTNNLHRLMIGISVLWFAIVLIYITQFFGWDNLFLMMPNEFGGFLAGITLPLAIIWVVMAYIDRGSSFKNEAKFLRAYMNQLVYPEEGTAKTAKAMADAIRSQIVELQEVTKVATKQTEVIKNELSGRVDDFSRLVALLDSYSNKSMQEVSENIETLTQSFDYVTTKAVAATDVFRQAIGEFSVSANSVETKLHHISDIVTPKINEFSNVSARLENLNNDNEKRMTKANDLLAEFAAKSSTNMEYISDLLSSQIERLSDKSTSVLDNYKSLEGRLNESADKVDSAVRVQENRVAGYVSTLAKNSEELVEKFRDHGDVIGVEIDKLLARSGGLEESIAIQVRDLDNVAKQVEDLVREVEDSINSQVVNLEGKTRYAIDNLTTFVDKFGDENNRISSIAEVSMEHADKIKTSIESKNNALKLVSDGIVVSLQSLLQELGNTVESVKNQTNDCVNKFKEVSEVVHKNTESLSEATSVIVSQNKVGESSFAQQHRHIADSVSKLEETKGELKRQIDELTRASSVINEEAETSLNYVRKQISEAITGSEDLANRSSKIIENIKKQVEEFDGTADVVVAKVSSVEDILSEKSKQLEEVSNVIVSRSDIVKETLDKHSKMVDESTKSSTQTFSNILSSFDSQSHLINSVAENTVSYVSEVVQALDEKAEAINLLFKHQENEFKDVCQTIGENTENISVSLKKHLSSIEQSSDRVLSKMSLLENDVNKRSDIVLSNSNRTIDKLKELDTSVETREKELDKLVSTAATKLNEVTDNFKVNIATFSDIIKDVKDESNATTSNLLTNFNKVKDVNDVLVKETKNITSIIDNNIKNIDEAMVKSKAQADSIKSTFEEQKERLTDIVNVVATQTRLGEASLTQQYKVLVDVSNDVSKKMKEIEDKFKLGTDKVFDTSGKIAYEVDVLGDRLLKVSEDINKSSKETIKDIEKVNTTLASCSEALAKSAQDSSIKVSAVVNSYENNVTKFNNVTDKASGSVIEISGLINDQSDKMIKISEDTKELVECFNVVLNDTSLELSNRANYAYDKVKGLGESFKNLSMQLEEATKLSSKHLENSGDKLRSSITEIAANADRISNEIRNSGEVFLKQSEVLVATTDETLKKVDNVMKSLNSSTTDFISKTDNIIQKSATFNEMFGKQIESLSENSKKAEVKIKELAKVYNEVELGNFLKSAAMILEQLETVSVDVNRLFNPDSEEDLWKKYYNGDSGAFVRHLEKTMTKKQIINIKDLFEKNGEFRSFVTKYLSEFELLLEKARSSDKSTLLLSVLSGSDIGKVYYIMAKALGKID